MQTVDLLGQMGGLQAIARELGVEETQVASGAEALLPALLGGFKKQAQSQPTGLAGLGDLVEGLGGGGLLDQVLAPEPTDPRPGHDVLGQVFGSKDVSRAVAQNAADRSGLDPALLKKMLPMLAMLVAGVVAKQHASGSATPPGAPSGGGLGGLLARPSAGAGAPPALGGLGALLDLDGDGNPLDDILKLAGQAMSRR